MISDGWLMIILKYTEYYPIYWGMIHHGNTVLHRPLPVGHCLVSKVEGHIAMWRKLWLLVCWWYSRFLMHGKKTIFGQKRSFFSTFCKYNPDVFPEFGYFLTFQKDFKELTVESWHFQMSWPFNRNLIFCHSFQVRTCLPNGTLRFSPLQLMANQVLNSLNIYNIL